jgi:hypothetical protein
LGATERHHTLPARLSASAFARFARIKAGPTFWSGEPWKLWVTDGPNGAGATLLTLQFAAIAGDVRAHDKKAAQLLAPDLHEIAAAAADKRK